MGINPLFQFFKQLYVRVREDEITALGAQMTYYLILAFFPFLIFLITVLNYTPLTDEDIISGLISVLPNEAAVMVNQILTDTLKANNQTLLSFGMIATLWAASRGVMAVIRGVNKAYGVDEKRSFLLTRSMSVIYIFIFVSVIILTFSLVVFGKHLGTLLFEWLHISYEFEYVWTMVQYAIPLTVMIVLFIFLYKTAPNEKVAWKEVLPGALFSTFGWLATSTLFSLYVTHFANYSKTYGSIGGIIVLLLWLYISSIIVLLGGELNAAIKEWRNNRIITVPKQTEE